MSKKKFAVRKMVSGYTGRDSYIVVMNPGGKRVSVHASTIRESAQAQADSLNDAEEQHQRNLNDPVWIMNRDHTEALYEDQERTRNAHFERIIAAQEAKKNREI